MSSQAILTDQARAAAGGWGTNTAVLDLPGGPYRIIGLSQRQAAWIAERYAGSLSQASPDATGATLCMSFGVAPPRNSVVINGAHMPTLVYDADGVRSAGLGYTAYFPKVPSGPIVIRTESDSESDTASALDNVLRMLVAYRMPELGGAVVHSAGIVADSGAWIFYGVSGSGKSTLSRRALAAGCELLSDDLNAVTPGPRGDRPLVRAVPFSGELAQAWRGNAAFPLRGLFRLRQGDGIRVVPHSPAVAVAALAVCCPYANSHPRIREPLLETLAGFAAAVPVGDVCFARDSDFRALLAALGAAA